MPNQLVSCDAFALNDRFHSLIAAAAGALKAPKQPSAAHLCIASCPVTHASGEYQDTDDHEHRCQNDDIRRCDFPITVTLAVIVDPHTLSIDDQVSGANTF